MADLAIPILISRDIQQSEAFYIRLGFQVLRHPEYGYLVMRRNKLELHMTLLDDKHVAENTACYIRVEDVAAWHADLAKRGGGQLSAIEEKPWGMREFALRDPDGNLIRFGEINR
jgi:catechol 2,3-dioxygenase-like lactoylglutathione lyase family enzyme